MKELSLNNGNYYFSVKELKERDRLEQEDIDRIVEYWDVLEHLMDNEDMEEANMFSNADVETVEGKIEYLIDYLSVAKDDLVLG